jgi:DNA-binding response OmpR family regulator
MPEGDKPTGDKPKILVIDDIADTRELLHMYLSKEGYQVIVAATGSEGLYMADAEKPALIITDIGLPDMDGAELIKDLRELEGLADVPIIAVTAYGDSRIQEAIKAGADRGTIKPTDLDALVADVKALFGEGH